jgi:hypothetical protein
VTSVDDLEVDGLKIYTIRTNPSSSADSDYNGIKPRDVVVYNKDQSVPGYAYERFDGTTGSTAQAGGTITGFATDESNQMVSTYANYKLKLRSKPSANVTLNLSATCGTRCDLKTTSLLFTTENWNTYQSVLVEGSSDSTNSGNQNYNVTFTVTSADNTYATVVAKPIFTIRSCDNDHNALIQPCNFSGSALGTAGGRFTGAEPSASNPIWMIAQAVPGSPISVPLSSSDTSEGTVPASITIDSSNYNTMIPAGTNKVALTHVDDALVDGSQNWTVVTGLSTGAVAYNPIDLYATTTDNEEYFYTRVVGNTSEDTVTTATIHVCLGANNPDAAITLNLSCAATVAGDANHGECGTLSVPSITFPIGSQVALANASDAGCPNDGMKQSFTVTGLDDTWADGTQPFLITLTKLATADTGYSAAPNPGNLTINNLDNEPAGKRVYVATGSYNGEMTAQGVVGADSNCSSNKPAGVPTGTYKALIVSNSAGQVTNDRTFGSLTWPIQANLHYYLCTGSSYANCSDEHQSLFVADGSKSFNPMSMDRDFSTTLTDEFWTGMTVGLAPETQASNPTAIACGLTYRHNCNGFTYQTCPDNPNPALYGQIWKNNGGGSIASSESICTASKKLICIQQ